MAKDFFSALGEYQGSGRLQSPEQRPAARHRLHPALRTAQSLGPAHPLLLPAGAGPEHLRLDGPLCRRDERGPLTPSSGLCRYGAPLLRVRALKKGFIFISLRIVYLKSFSNFY